MPAFRRFPKETAAPSGSGCTGGYYGNPERDCLILQFFWLSTDFLNASVGLGNPWIRGCTTGPSSGDEESNPQGWRGWKDPCPGRLVSAGPERGRSDSVSPGMNRG